MTYSSSKNSTVYWNNVCLLTHMERKFIQKVQTGTSLPFDFEFYGLGQSCSLTHQIKTDLTQQSARGDIIVTTDLEAFQDNALLPYFRSFRQDFRLPLRAEIAGTSIPHPQGFIQPFIIIPLVLVVNTNLLGPAQYPQSLEDLLHPSFRKRYAFGGLHNSAGRSLLKSLWFLYGADTAEAFADGAVVTSMPAHAFQKVMKAEVAAALVPTIFALRQGIHGLKSFWPREGAVAIPSYAAARTSVAREDLDLFSESIVGRAHQEELKNNGDIIPCHPDVALPASAAQNGCRLLYPAWDFYAAMDYGRFVHICEKYKPVA